MLSNHLPMQAMPLSLIVGVLCFAMVGGQDTDGPGLQGPGMVYVSEGDTALLLWRYDTSIGDFNSVYVHKVKPATEWKLLLQKDNDQEKVYDERVRWVGANAGIALSYTRVEDTGTYEIDVILNDRNATISYSDSAQLEVKRQSMWLLRPGNVYACQKDTADFLWVYDPRIGGMNSVYFYKLPSRELLLSLTDGMVDYRSTRRVGKMRNSAAGMILKNCLPEDSGRYEVEVTFDDYSKRIYDQAELTVMSGCPKREFYNHPNITYSMAEVIEIVTNDTVMVDRTGNLTLHVTIPAGEPPVACVITSNSSKVACMGRHDDQTICEVELYIAVEGMQLVEVTLSHMIYEPSKTTITVICEEMNAGATEGSSAQTAAIVVGVCLSIVVLVSLASLAVIYYLYRKNKSSGKMEKEKQPNMDVEESVPMIEENSHQAEYKSVPGKEYSRLTTNQGDNASDDVSTHSNLEDTTLDLRPQAIPEERNWHSQGENDEASGDNQEENSFHSAADRSDVSEGSSDQEHEGANGNHDTDEGQQQAGLDEVDVESQGLEDGEPEPWTDDHPDRDPPATSQDIISDSMDSEEEERTSLENNTQDVSREVHIPQQETNIGVEDSYQDADMEQYLKDDKKEEIPHREGSPSQLTGEVDQSPKESNESPVFDDDKLSPGPTGPTGISGIGENNDNRNSDMLTLIRPENGYPDSEWTMKME